jgi:hypothetical protein
VPPPSQQTLRAWRLTGSPPSQVPKRGHTLHRHPAQARRKGNCAPPLRLLGSHLPLTRHLDLSISCTSVGALPLLCRGQRPDPARPGRISRGWGDWVTPFPPRRHLPTRLPLSTALPRCATPSALGHSTSLPHSSVPVSQVDLGFSFQDRMMAKLHDRGKTPEDICGCLKSGPLDAHVLACCCSIFVRGRSAVPAVGVT